MPYLLHLFRFNFSLRVVKFLSGEGNKRVMLIQGGAGAGKTLFARFLERFLWQNFDNGFIPIFVSLPKALDPYSKLLNQVVQELGLSELDTSQLTTEKFVFILDGLDELSLEKMPSEGILLSNKMLDLHKAHFIITSRNHYITALEVKFGVSVYEHLVQQPSLLEEVFMMPFDTAQVFIPTKNKTKQNKTKQNKKTIKKLSFCFFSNFRRRANLYNRFKNILPSIAVQLMQRGKTGKLSGTTLKLSLASPLSPKLPSC
jgi:hypothetical protein